jgi:hypothetical protein
MVLRRFSHPGKVRVVVVEDVVTTGGSLREVGSISPREVPTGSARGVSSTGARDAPLFRIPSRVCFGSHFPSMSLRPVLSVCRDFPCQAGSRTGKR